MLAPWCLTLMLILVLGLAAPSLAAQANRVVVHPIDDGAALCNPDMGWVFHYYDNNPQNYGSRLAPSDTLDDFPGLTVIYLRIPWSYIEPEEGKFDWSTLDTPAQRWIAKGKKIALRLTCCESWTRYATPEWVQKDGAKGHNFTPGKLDPKGPYWEPDYDDPVFLNKLDNFLAAVAKRYDGNPEVAFIDVGSFGVWGEGHTWSSTQLPYSAATIRRHIDLHLKNFHHTLLAANDDLAMQGRGQQVIDYAFEHGLTLRDDSILVQGGAKAFLSDKMAQPFWPKRPVILESEHYGGSRDRGAWGDGHLYLKAVEAYHASYVSIHWWPHEFLKACRPLIHKMNLRLGYRLQPTEVSWPATVPLDGQFQISSTWRNEGVAPCYPGGHVAITLKDAKGGIAAVFVDQDFDVHDLPVGPPGKAETRSFDKSFLLPYNLRGGKFDVFISVGTLTGTPKIALPLAGDDGQHRYRLGSVLMTGDYRVTMGTFGKRGDQWVLPLTWTTHNPLPPGTMPFVHFDGPGPRGILFMAEPAAGSPIARLEKPGTVTIDCVFSPPAKARGGTYPVAVGLWTPDLVGKPNERAVPDSGELDRRVPIGTVTVAKDGAVTFKPVEAPPK